MQDELSTKEKASFVFGIHGNELPRWDLSTATEIANEEGITLTDEHIDVIQYLRMTYKKHGPARHARSLSQALQARFAIQGGSKYLYRLFPKGPVAQGCKLAGIPGPADCADRSFGSSF